MKKINCCICAVIVSLLIIIGYYQFGNIRVCSGKIRNDQYMTEIPLKYYLKGKKLLDDLKNEKGDALRYTYAYIDDNKTPELIIGTGGTHADGMLLYVYRNNQYTFLSDLNVPGYLRYHPYGNIIQSDFGGQGYFQLAFTGLELDENFKYTYIDALTSDGSMTTYPDTKYYHNAGEEVFNYLGIDMPLGKDYTPIPISKSEYEELYSTLMGNVEEIVFLDYCYMMHID